MSRVVSVRLASLGIGIFVALALGEGLGRLAAPILLPGPNTDMQFDPQLGWTQKTGLTSEHVNEAGERIKVEGSALGMRQGARRPPAIGIKRTVLALGDSFTAGTQLRLEQCWPSLVEEGVRRAGDPIEVVNAGVDGYGLDQEYWLLERLAPVVRPQDVVVAVYVGNDIADYEGDAWSLPPWARFGPQAWLRTHSYLFHLLSRAKRDLSGVPREGQIRAGAPPSSWAPSSIRNFRSLSKADRENIRRQFASPELLPAIRGPQAMHRIRLTERMLEALTAAVQSRGARFWVVLIPYKLQVIAEERDEWMRLHGLSIEEVFRPQAELNSWALRVGVALADSTEAMLRNAAPGSLFWPVDGHLSVAGHQVVADVTLRLLGGRRSLQQVNPRPQE